MMNVFPASCVVPAFIGIGIELEGGDRRALRPRALGPTESETRRRWLLRSERLPACLQRFPQDADRLWSHPVERGELLLGELRDLLQTSNADARERTLGGLADLRKRAVIGLFRLLRGRCLLRDRCLLRCHGRSVTAAAAGRRRFAGRGSREALKARKRRSAEPAVLVAVSRSLTAPAEVGKRRSREVMEIKQKILPAFPPSC